MKLTVLVLAWLSCTLANAQQPFPTAADEPRWSVAWYILGWYQGTDAFQCTTSVDLCGSTYSIVEEVYWGGTAYFRNEGQRTLLRRSTDCSVREHLMYDFSMNVGDSTYIGWETLGSGEDTTLAIVQAIDTIELAGITRRRFSLLVDRCPDEWNEPLFTNMEWIEGIGSTTHPFYPIICLCDYCESATILQCADSSGVSTYTVSPETNCDRTLRIEDTVQPNRELRAFTSNGSLQVTLPGDLQDGTVRIHDTIGRKVLQQRITRSASSIDIAILPAGPYLIMLEDGLQRWSTKWHWAP